MIQDASTIECNIDQSEFLTNVAAAILNVVNAELDSVQTPDRGVTILTPTRPTVRGSTCSNLAQRVPCTR
ncbi:MAG: hypothetical protein HC836_37185 [Richelia sp. RM2_1_2]|nr:hypothetical protein [Richelia sp. RM2_1_2]